MPAAAKLFMNGRSQAVRLPAEFRFEGDEVNIRKDPATGDVVLSQQRTGNWDEFFHLVEELGPIEEDFLMERDRTPPVPRAFSK
ncbi:AbrB/MazE/SpoVT family DNA-binding domain-containing protein [Granulicella sp. 5B5]|uniref:antitoxin n=1 Tax=Granulicella sp. 5B5 TaxID=1617967 RepID=UPI0015F5A96A|nr:AbrB/MazE/SpoVT family DNA-binding domain-containing protein [Granulicella sp. 5B5]QMV19181.1 AbrB/MazE/SpoVT family DNA-binding domain-containing protein [Granulicella sp. 5B5]